MTHFIKVAGLKVILPPLAGPFSGAVPQLCHPVKECEGFRDTRSRARAQMTHSIKAAGFESHFASVLVHFRELCPSCAVL